MQLSIVILSLMLATVSAAKVHDNRVTCLSNSNECTADVECCNGCCIENQCVDDFESCSNHVIAKRASIPPTCKDLNPPCKPPSHCYLQQVQCVMAPCYPIPTCTSTE